jgi:hypothetical protein
MSSLVVPEETRIVTVPKSVTSQGLTAWFVIAVAAGGTVLWALDGAAGATGAAAVMLLYFIVVGLRVDWRFGEDAADSLYFLGFLFTVSLLAFSFLRLNGSGKAGLESVLAAVGEGLLLTVWGLLGRQVAILHSAGVANTVAEIADSPARSEALASAERVELGERVEPAVRAHTAPDDAAREASAAARKLKVVAGQLESAASALASAGQMMTSTASGLVTSVEESSRHIIGASQQSAIDITSAAHKIREQLQSGVREIAGGFGAVTDTLDKHGKLLREATETESNAALASLRKLGALGEESRALATTATQAVRASARLLAEQANAIPDPRGPTIQYSDALTQAARAIHDSGNEAARAAQTISGNLGNLSRQMKSMSDETEDVVKTARLALEKTRAHFELFRQLEKEYVVLVEEVGRRASKERVR